VSSNLLFFTSGDGIRSSFRKAVFEKTVDVQKLN